MATIDEVLARIRGAGGRVTATKRAVITVMASHPDDHLTAETIGEHVIRQLPDTHQSTVYRILHELEGLDVLRHVHLGHGPSTYHFTEDQHHHAVCDSCGAVVELPSDLYDGLASQLLTEHGFALNVPHFALAGRCEACRAG